MYWNGVRESSLRVLALAFHENKMIMKG